MLLKLAWRNIRHSVRDYTIYFLTLLFGVAVFYAFNSIGGQEVMFDLEASADMRMFETTQYFMGMFSWLIACVLGFLILYSNGFLIRRRKREFGTYLLLGMRPGQVSRIMLAETVLVGLASLVLGLILGFLLSQALAFFTAMLFGATIKHYQFVFSPDAFWMTIICFAIIYVVVAIFNTVTVNRQKLIDLLHAEAANQKVVVRNPWVSLVAFLCAIGLLAFAYEQLIESGLVMLDDPRFLRATVCMLVGTFILFWSLSGFAIAIITRAKGVYLRGLVPFTTRQIASRVNTAFVSLWAVCIMLFFSITVFSVGMGLVDTFTTGIQEANPYSATLGAEIYDSDPVEGGADRPQDPAARAKAMQVEVPERFANAEAHGWDMASPLMEAAPVLWEETVASAGQVDFYSLPGVTFGDALSQVGPLAVEELEQVSSRLPDLELPLASLSDVNALRALTGDEPLHLDEGQCLLANNMDVSAKVAPLMANPNVTIDAMGHELTYSKQICSMQFEDNALKATALITIVPDSVIDELQRQGIIPDRSILDVMYANNGKSEAENDAALAQIVAAAQPPEMGGFDGGFAAKDEPYARLLWPVTHIYTAHEMISQAGGMKMMITYLAIYIGFIFLIATAAILAVQQLSQTTDSLPRYRMLFRLGADRRMVGRSLLAQVGIYFLLPLGVAACHATCAIVVTSGTLFEALGVSVGGPIAMAAAFVTVIYGGYFAVTYLTSRSAVTGAMRA